MFTPVRAITVAAIAAVAAAVAIPALTTAQAPGGRDITVREKVRAVKIVDIKPRSRHQRIGRGDRVITQQALFKPGGGRTGTLFTDCVGVGSTAQLFKATLQCTTTDRFKDGQLVAAGVVRLGD